MTSAIPKMRVVTEISAARQSGLGVPMLLANRLSGVLLVLLASAFGAGVAWASGGVVEINQAAALAGEVSPGDLPGYPVTLSESGSYQLTSALVVPGTSAGIEILAANVTLDLAGFPIAGTNLCAAPASGVSCLRTTGGDGIASTRDFVAVRNGRVEGFRVGVSLFGRGARVDNVSVAHNGSNGVQVGRFGFVRHLGATLNGGNGVSMDRYGQVEGVRAFSNGVAGIRVTQGTLVSNSQAAANETGLTAVSRVLVRGGTYSGNRGAGISMQGELGLSGVVLLANGEGVVDNSVTASRLLMTGTTVRASQATGVEVSGEVLSRDGVITENAGDGIACLSPAVGGTRPCLFVNQLVERNTGIGLRAPSGSGVVGSRLGGNGQPTSAGVTNLGGNLCGAIPCP